MTDKIKVKGKKYMSESSERKELFATEYEAAVKKGYQEFMLKIEDSEADAVTAFLNLLNELQEMVYEVYPQTVKKYAKVLSSANIEPISTTFDVSKLDTFNVSNFSIPENIEFIVVILRVSKLETSICLIFFKS